MSARPYYEEQWCDNYDAPEPPEPEENVVCVCDCCGENIYDCDEMAVVEEHRLDVRCHITHICMDCWNANKWDKAEELLDMIGVWYWTGDVVPAMQIALDHQLKERERNKRMIGVAADMYIAAVNNGKGNT